jgi:hypothetical protein
MARRRLRGLAAIVRRSARPKLTRRRNAFGEIQTRDHGAMTPEVYEQRFGKGPS